MYHIETGIKPKEKKRGKTQFLRNLKVGESFLAPLSERANILNLARQGRIKITTEKEGHQVRVYKI